MGFLLNQILRIGMMILFSATIIAGCASTPHTKPAEEELVPVLEWNQKAYADFLKENMKNLNEKYSTEYVPWDFIVDTDNGSIPIEKLIDDQAVESVLETFELKQKSRKEKVKIIYEYVLSEYLFTPNPESWHTVEETIQTRKGDCKDLSLLLMSMLMADYIPVYGAISNGHMWVNVYQDKKWVVLEVDKDPHRNRIYSIPGFYENPLFKVFPKGTVKREKF